MRSDAVARARRWPDDVVRDIGVLRSALEARSELPRREPDHSRRVGRHLLGAHQAPAALVSTLVIIRCCFYVDKQQPPLPRRISPPSKEGDIPACTPLSATRSHPAPGW